MVSGAKKDHLTLDQFTDALFDLCIVDGENSFANSYLDNYKDGSEEGEEDNVESMRAAILVAAVDQYFADESSEEEDD